MVGSSPRTIRCVVVGDGAVGKTSMLLNYTTKGYSSDYVPTFYDNFNVSMAGQDETYKMNLVDTSGQVTYDRLRTLAYYDTDLFILCFSLVDPTSFENLSGRWIPELREYRPNTPFMLVGTHLDVRDNLLKGVPGHGGNNNNDMMMTTTKDQQQQQYHHGNNNNDDMMTTTTKDQQQHHQRRRHHRNSRELHHHRHDDDDDSDDNNNNNDGDDIDEDDGRGLQHHPPLPSSTTNPHPPPQQQRHRPPRYLRSTRRRFSWMDSSSNDGAGGNARRGRRPSEMTTEFVSKRKASKWAKRHGAVSYVECSSMTGDGVDEVFQVALQRVLTPKKESRLRKSLRKFFWKVKD